MMDEVCLLDLEHNFSLLSHFWGFFVGCSSGLWGSSSSHEDYEKALCASSEGRAIFLFTKIFLFLFK